MSEHDSVNEQVAFNVEVIYALPHLQKRLQVKVLPGTSCIEVVRKSGINAFFPELDLDTVKLGIFSRLVKNNEIIQQGQRIEIYRPLIADPKDVRRRRAEKAKEEGRANKITGGRA
ncbi:RnfH family protein [uncultured Shewanella sp.]|uniref:RnfH family protein n=1 Tax=uncultured Shewanella sp. TaxID=173975 RepID=UPI0026374F9A|nr:RnfH family protein [uncultured Shewanella sp.]